MSTGISEDEFEKFVIKFRDHLYILAYSVLRNTMDAQDAVSESFLKMWKNRSRLRDSSKLYAWACKIVLNTARTMLRKNRRIVLVDQLPEKADMSASAKDSEALWDYVAQLNEQERIAVLLYYYEGYKQSEISKMLHIPESTLKSRLRKARRDLRELICGEEPTLRQMRNMDHENGVSGI